MTNIEKYNQIFIDSFQVSESELQELQYNSTPMWSSVGQMTLISELEEIFDIIIAPDDIMAIDSYDAGKDILANNYNIIF